VTMSTKGKAAPAGTGNGSQIDLRGNPINTEDNRRHCAPQAPQPVHIGENCIGFLISLPAGYEAITRFGDQLGLYNTAIGAATALAARAISPGIGCLSCSG